MITEIDPHEKVKHELRNLALRLKESLEELKRPLTIEFSGTPKSGKTTSVGAISKFLRRHEIPVHVVTERASICPISDKHHLFFNIWTAATSLAQMLEAFERRVSVVILDRGIFDSLVWIDFLRTWHAVSPAEIAAIEQFLLIERFVNRIDIVVALSADPKSALQREFKDQITDETGSIMNLKNLAEYNESLIRCLAKYKSNFRRILHIETTERKPVDGVAEIAFEVISTAGLLADEKIAVVDRKLVADWMPSSGVMTQQDELADFHSRLASKMKWIRRTTAEDDSSLVQLVPVATIRRKHEILLLTIRGEKQGKRIENRQSIWAGGHSRLRDLPKGGHKKTLFHRSLIRELDEELHIILDLEDLSLLPSAIVWDKTHPKSLQHLALFYQYQVPNATPKEVLHQREFWESPRKSLFTQFIPLDQSLLEVREWEFWSALYLREVHKLAVPIDVKQFVMF